MAIVVVKTVLTLFLLRHHIILHINLISEKFLSKLLLATLIANSTHKARPAQDGHYV